MAFCISFRLPTGAHTVQRSGETADRTGRNMRCRYVERWVGSARRECLDQMLILNERHLLRVLTAYTTFYNERRPHQGLDQRCPVPFPPDPGAGPVRCRKIIGGILHDYHRESA
jgi:hypothetical protein